MNVRKRFASMLALILAFLWMGLVTTGCNTAEGLGEDAEELGDSIEDTLDDDDAS